MKKYDPLKDYLISSKCGAVRLTFAEIEDILHSRLPHSAFSYQAWWANGGHDHANAWLEAGYTVSDLRLTESTVTFLRTGKATRRKNGGE